LKKKRFSDGFLEKIFFERFLKEIFDLFLEKLFFNLFSMRKNFPFRRKL